MVPLFVGSPLSWDSCAVANDLKPKPESIAYLEDQEDFVRTFVIISFELQK